MIHAPLRAVAPGAQAKPGPVTSVEVTFSGHGTGKMTADVNHQRPRAAIG
jgi:hypothetical protein